MAWSLALIPPVGNVGLASGHVGLAWVRRQPNSLKYRRTKDVILVYGGMDNEPDVKCYINTGHQTNRDSTRSQSGYDFFMKGGSVAWRSSTQNTVAMLSTEYIVVSEAAKLAVWMRKYIRDLGVVSSIEYPMKMYCDNSSAILLENEPLIQRVNQHILRKCAYINEVVERNDVEVVKVHTYDNITDPLTKALPREKHDMHANRMGIRDVD
ncbi:hypothetical protein Tco_0559530 [Tanacetum coccineum]